MDCIRDKYYSNENKVSKFLRYGLFILTNNDLYKDFNDDLIYKTGSNIDFKSFIDDENEHVDIFKNYFSNADSSRNVYNIVSDKISRESTNSSSGENLIEELSCLDTLTYYYVTKMLKNYGYTDADNLIINDINYGPRYDFDYDTVTNLHVQLGDGSICRLEDGAIVYDHYYKKTYNKFQFRNRPYYMSDNHIHYFKNGIWINRRSPLKINNFKVQNVSEQIRSTIQKELDLERQQNEKIYNLFIDGVVKSMNDIHLGEKRIKDAFTKLENNTLIHSSPSEVALRAILVMCGKDPDQVSSFTTDQTISIMEKLETQIGYKF